MRLSLLVLFGLLVGAALARTHTVYADEDDDNNDNSQALEEEDSAPVVAETHNFANDVDDDDDDDAPSVASASKVFSHIESLQEAISSSSLESEDLDAALDNLKHIKQDAHRMERESASSRQSLKQAIHLRMEALKMQLKGDADAEAKDDDDDDDDNVVAAKDNVLEEKPGDDDEENDIAGADDDNNNNKNDDEDAIQKITKDISRVQDGINAEVLGQKMARKAMRNLDAIRTDASRYETSDSATREKLSKAMKLRVAALKLMLEAPEAPSHAEDSIAHSAKRVEGDIAHIESEISKAGLSKHAKREALDNLHAMKRDAEELASKPTLTRSRQLKRAMKLRMHALHEQLQ